MGTHYKCLAKALLMSTHNSKFSLKNKKTIQIPRTPPNTNFPFPLPHIPTPPISRGIVTGLHNAISFAFFFFFFLLQIREYTITQIVSLFVHENILCGYSLEVPQQGASNEHPQCMFLRTVKEISVFFSWKKCALSKVMLLDGHGSSY